MLFLVACSFNLWLTSEVKTELLEKNFLELPMPTEETQDQLKKNLLLGQTLGISLSTSRIFFILFTIYFRTVA